MFARLSVVTLSLFTILAAAAPNGGNPPVTTTVTVTHTPVPTATEPASQCNTGPVQCCQSVQQSDSSAVTTLFGLLGIVLQGVAVPVGITCTPIDIIGIGGESCSSQPVCCENNNFNGVVAIGCTPINLSL